MVAKLDSDDEIFLTELADRSIKLVQEFLELPASEQKLHNYLLLELRQIASEILLLHPRSVSRTPSLRLIRGGKPSV